VPAGADARKPLPGESPHYEAVEGQAHHHLVCRRCHAMIHLDESLLGNLNEQLQEQYGYHSLTLDLVAAGYCDTCWKAMQQQSQCSSRPVVTQLTHISWNSINFDEYSLPA
jgi:Ferric uptake regulator family